MVTINFLRENCKIGQNINEKFAVEFFRDNHSIASSYAKMVANMMRRDSKITDNPIFEKLWQSKVESLREALAILYKALDKEQRLKTIVNQ